MRHETLAAQILQKPCLPPVQSRSKFYFALPILIALGFTAYSHLQFSTPSLVGTDAYYHVKLADLMGEERISNWPISFPWLPKTVLSPTEFTDHHFLYHAFMIPFWKLPWIGNWQPMLEGSKWATVTFATLTLAAILWCLPSRSASAAALTTLSYFAISPALLYRMSMQRAQSLSLVILTILTVALIERKHWWVFILSFLYVWLYNAFPILLLLAGSFAAVDLIEQKKIPWSTFMPAVLGVIAGLIINPYFPENLVFLYHHLIDKFVPSGYQVKVGNEWYPYPLKQFCMHILPGLLCYLGVFFALWKNSKLRRRELLALVLFTGVLLILNLKSRRFVELFPPFALFTLFYATSNYLTKLKPALTAVLALGLLVGSYFSLQHALWLTADQEPYNKYRASAEWLRLNSNPGELVIASDWDDFTRLFHFNHHNVYLVGLDPYFLYAKDPELFHTWKDFTQGIAQQPPSSLLEEKFNSRFVFTDRDHRKLEKLLRTDPRMHKRFSSPDSSVWVVE